MIRITYNKEISDAWRAKKNVANIQHRRVYRWGTKWAYASPWKVETRTSFHQSDTLVELCSPTSDQQPPYEVDDMWDEEVFLLPHIEYTGLLSLVGTPQELQAVMTRDGLPVVPLPSVQPMQPVQHPKLPTKSKCLIED
jgi:hypothetical protein